MGAYLMRYFNDVRDLNAWIRAIPLWKRTPVLLTNTVMTLLCFHDYEWVLATLYPFGSFLIAAAGLCLVLTPFWIGHDAVHWCCRHGFDRGIV